MARKIVLAALGYLLVTFPLGYVWHLVLFREAYESFGVYTRASPIIPMGIASMVIQGFILAWIYAPLAERSAGKPYVGAIRYSLLMGLFFTSGTVLALAAKAEIAHVGAWFAYGIAFSLIQFLLTGAVFGWAFRRRSA